MASAKRYCQKAISLRTSHLFYYRSGQKTYFKGADGLLPPAPNHPLFDFNVVITNLNKMDKADALELVSALRRAYSPRLN